MTVHIRNHLLVLRFIDSIHFMYSSLSELVNNLKDEYFKFIKPEDSDLKSKQFFPYDYVPNPQSPSIKIIFL